MTEEMSVKNHRDWNSFIECIGKNKTKIKVLFVSYKQSKLLTCMSDSLPDIHQLFI